MNDVLGHNSVSLYCTGDNLMRSNFGMKHAPGAGLITQSADLQSSVTWLPPERKRERKREREREEGRVCGWEVGVRVCVCVRVRCVCFVS